MIAQAMNSAIDEEEAWQAVLAPKGLPTPLRDRIHDAFRRFGVIRY